MKKTAAILVVLALVAGMAGVARAQSAEDAKFKKFLDSFWDAYFKFYPTAGTLQGFTKYNDRLEDPSEGALDKFHETLTAFNTEIVSKMDPGKLSADVQLEREMLLDFLDLEFVKLETTLPWNDNPMLYNDLFVQSLRSLLLKNGGAAVVPATARAKAIPGLIKRAKDSLKNPPREYTQAAIDQMPAIIEFYRTDVAKLSGGAAALQAEVAKCIPALEDYQRFLQGDLLAKSTGNFRVGDPYMRILQRKTQGNLPIKETIIPQSQADVKNIRNAMGEICIPYFKLMNPAINPDQLAAQKGVDAAVTAVIQGVFDKLKVDHVAREGYLDRVGQGVANLKGFIQKTTLFDVPPDDPKLEAMPGYMGAGLWFSLSGPGAFEASGPFTVYARTIPQEWTPEQANSFLEEHNNFAIDLAAARSVFPGSFAAAYFARRDPSVVKRIAGNEGLLAGWPIYAQNQLLFAGYGDYDLRVRLYQLKLLLKAAIDFQMDMNVHLGTYTKEKVVDYMMRSGFMSQAEAEAHWNRIVLNPGISAYAYIGYQEILDMEKEYRKLKGDSFSSKDFLQKLVSFGAIPLRTLRTKIAQ